MYLILFILFCVLGLITYFMFFMSNSLTELNLSTFFSNIFVIILTILFLLSFVLEFWLFLNIFLFFYSFLNVAFTNVNFSFFCFVFALLQAFVIFFTYCFYSNYSSLFVFIYLVHSNSFGVTSIVLFYKPQGDSCFLNSGSISLIFSNQLSHFFFNEGGINFYCMLGYCYSDHFNFFSEIYKLELMVNNNVSTSLFGYSVFLHSEICKVKGKDFISYDSFVSVFMMYVNSHFYESWVNSGIYFLSVKFNFDINFWLSNLGSDGKFLDTFLNSIYKGSNFYKTLNFNFLVYEYDYNNSTHTSSSLVDCFSLYSDFNNINFISNKYHWSSNGFVLSNNNALSNSYNLSNQDTDIFYLECSSNPDYEVFLKYYSWS